MSCHSTGSSGSIVRTTVSPFNQISDWFRAFLFYLSTHFGSHSALMSHKQDWMPDSINAKKQKNKKLSNQQFPRGLDNTSRLTKPWTWSECCECRTSKGLVLPLYRRTCIPHRGAQPFAEVFSSAPVGHWAHLRPAVGGKSWPARPSTGSRRVFSPARLSVFECGGKQRCFTVYLFSKATKRGGATRHR